jgi:hexosaminidase
MPETAPLFPQPGFELLSRKKSFPLEAVNCISIPDKHYESTAEQLRNWLQGITGKFPRLVTGQEPGEVVFQKSLLPLGEEGYTLSITPAKCTIFSSGPKGAFYAFQTLRQLPGSEKESFFCCHIEDKPAFSWRGVLLDSSRTFCSIDEMYRLVDLIASLKFNVLHWHLSDDQGWRIALDSYPELTASGTDFYSKEEVRALVDYSLKRNVNIVPEIDMPGHFLAALTACPQFSCTGGPFEVPGTSGISPDLLCAGKDASLTFAAGIIGEICELFPSPYIHLGGDEIPLGRWETCPDCRKRKNELGLADERALLSWFAGEMAKRAREAGKQVIMWDDYMDESYDPAIISHNWNPLKRNPAIEKEAGRPSIRSDYFRTYLDLDHALISLKSVYTYGSYLQKLKKSDPALMGAEFLLWTEHIHTREERDTHLFPRLVAGAESLWTDTASLDYRRFTKKLRKTKRTVLPHKVTFTPGYKWDPPLLLRFLRKRQQKRKVLRNSREAGIIL